MDLDEEDDPDPDIDDDSVADNISNGQGNDEDNEIVDAQITDVHFDDKNPQTDDIRISDRDFSGEQRFLGTSFQRC